MKILPAGLIVTILACILSGCSAGGSPFLMPDKATQGKALVYFFRPSAFVGNMASPTLVDNGKEIGDIENGQFVKYEALPGKHKFHTDTMIIDKETEFDLVAGETYYIRAALQQGFWTSTWQLTRIFPEEALQEMKSCCKSGS